MSYTIVYDRRFLRCGDRFIPMCLYGDNNVSETNYRTGREVRARDWGTFVYSDDMLLGTADEILKIARKFHPAYSTDTCGGVKFHGKFLNDEEMYRFFKNGIAGAITLEDLLIQTTIGSIQGKLEVYGPENGRDNAFDDDTAYLRTSAELSNWVNEAKTRKAQILQSGRKCHVYICLYMATTRDPLQVSVFADRTAPVVAYEMESGRKKRSYVKSFTETSTSFTVDFTEAFVFDNIDDAYLSLPKWSAKSLRFCYADKEKERAEREPGKYVVSATYLGRRVYIYQKYRNKIAFSHVKGNDLRRFSSEKMALKWFEEKIHAAQPLFTDPVVEEL